MARHKKRVEAGMLTLTAALAAERGKRQNLKTDDLAKQQVARAVLGVLAGKLHAVPVAGWRFVFEDQAIRIVRTAEGSQHELGNWTMDDKMRLVCGDATTEWITSESYARVIDEAVALTARLIVEFECATSLAQLPKPVEDIGIVELRPRWRVTSRSITKADGR